MTESKINQLCEHARALAESLVFFDSNIWLGQPEGYPPARPLGSDQLESVLRENILHGGLVSHWRGLTVSPQGGNRALEIPLPPNIYTIWTGLPFFPAEPGPLPGNGEISKDVRGVRIFPKSHHFPLTDWSVGGLCEWLCRHRIPLFIRHTEVEWPHLYTLGKKFSNLTIIVETQTQKILYHTRALFALMKECKNILVELSNFAGAGFVEYAAEEFGAERLIYGSFLPMNDPRVAMGMILDADICEKGKKMIAGDNLRRLIEEVR